MEVALSEENNQAFEEVEATIQQIILQSEPDTKEKKMTSEMIIID